MDFASLSIAALIAATLTAGTPLALAGLGLLIHERAGVLNLGAEGVMLLAAVAGFAATFHTGSASAGFAAGAAAGAVAGLVFGLLAIGLNANQYATGLALSLLGSGLSAFLGSPYVGKKLEVAQNFAVPFLSELPFVGEALFRQHPLAYISWVLALGLLWFFDRSRTGLVLRSIGENPEAAHALGYRVRALRMLATCVGGAVCGLGGAFLSIAYTPLWVEGMVAGRGWIALALTAFATWRAGRVMVGAYLFGGVTMLQLSLQAAGIAVPLHFMNMLPYVACIVVLVLISRNPAWIRQHMPASLGKAFVAGK
jgi:general nucleoside transport system permease protein